MPVVAAQTVTAQAVTPSVVTPRQTGSDTIASVAFTLPAAKYELTESVIRSTGRMGGLITGHYVLLGSTHYIWWHHGVAAPDPALYVAALGSRTGIRVDLPANDVSRAGMATATASAVTAAGFSATASTNRVTVDGFSSAANGGIGYDASGRQGILGTPDNRVLGLNSFAAASLRACLLDPTDLPSNPFVFTGAQVAIGNVHTDSLVISIWQDQAGGGSDTDFQGAALLGSMVTSGSGTVAWENIQSSGILVDPTQGRVWVGIMHAVGAVQLPFTFNGQPSANGTNFVVAGGNAIRLMTSGPESSDPADLPATLGSVASSEIGILPIRLSFLETPIQSDVAPVVPIGTLAGYANGERDDTFTFPSTTDDGLYVANSYNVPSGYEGFELYRMAVNYLTHVEGDDYRLQLGVGGLAADDLYGISAYDVGQTTGSATGWNYVDAPAGIPLTPGTRFWLILEYHESSLGTGISFNLTGGSQFENDTIGDAHMYGGEATESEYAPLSNPIVSSGQETTNIDFDSTTASPAGAAGESPETVEPDGFNFRNSNNVGVHAYGVFTGFEVVPAA